MKLPKTWKMKDGAEIKINKMETSHLMYSIAMVERTIEKHNDSVVSGFRDAMDAQLGQRMLIDPAKHELLTALWNELDKREVPTEGDKIRKKLKAFEQRLENEIYRSEQRSLHDVRYEEAFKDGLQRALDIFNKKLGSVTWK